MTVTWDEVVNIVEQRRSQNAPLIQQMLEVRRRYDGDIAIPVPQLDTSPVLPALTPALMAGTIDSYAIRAASVRPRVECPPIDALKDQGTKSQEFARIRQKTIYATWHMNKLSLGLRRVYRHISGYATAVMVVTPDYMTGYPTIEVRDPLGSYPEAKASEDLTPVANCGFIYERSADYLRTRFPEARRENGGPIGSPGHEPELWDIVEWLDADTSIVGILGPRDFDSTSATDCRRFGVNPTMKLRQWQNIVGRCPVVTTPRITLDKITSQVAHQIGNIDLQAKMLALAIVAEERAIFPDRYVIGKEGMAPRIVSAGGNWADGRTGVTNLLEGVVQVGQLDSAPPQSTGRTIDMLERNYHVSVGDNPTFGGETYGSLRTGRGIDSMLGAQVDPRVQEMQEMVEYGLSHVNELVLDTWKACFGHEKQTLFSGWGGVSDVFELDAPKHIENNANVVSYAIAGADVQAVTIQLGQMFGTGALSMRSFRNRHPWIEDAEYEEQQMELEKLKDASFQAILQGASTGQMPPQMLVMIWEEMKTGANFFEAQSRANAKLQAMQAAQAPPPGAPEGTPPTAVGAPEAQPGLAGGPGGAQMQPPPEEGTIGAAPNTQNLSALMAAMRSENRPVPVR